MNKRGAVELSMSTVVIVVIAIVLLSLGIVFVKSIMGKITKMSEGAMIAADESIQELMGGDKAFFISGTIFTNKPGGTIEITAGIQNFLGKDMKFKIEIESADGESDVKWIETLTYKTVKAGEKGGIPIIVSIPKTARSGSTAMYSINVYDAEEKLYGSESIAINVK